MSGRGAREKILAAATRLFYAHGINNVGVDRVVVEAKVTKTSLYRHFPSKELLVLAFLERINAEWSEWMKVRVKGSSADPTARLLAVFDALGDWFKTPTFRGCPFINTSAETPISSSPPAKAARAFKRAFRIYLRTLAREAGIRDAELLADQMLLLADGAIVRAAMMRDPGSAAVAKRAARALIEATGKASKAQFAKKVRKSFK